MIWHILQNKYWTFGGEKENWSLYKVRYAGNLGNEETKTDLLLECRVKQQTGLQKYYY